MILSFALKVFKKQVLSRMDQSQEVTESILRFFPGFLGFNLPPPSPIPEVLKNINRNKSQIEPDFLSGLKKFKELLRSALIAKQSFDDGEIVTGEGRACIVK